MKLKVYTAIDRSNHCSVGLRFIGIRRKARRVTLSRLFVKDEGIELNDATYAILSFDEESKADWYIALGDYPQGFKVNSSKDKSKYGTTHYFAIGQVAAQILDTCKIKESANFLVAEKPIESDGVKWYKIITAKPVSSK